MQYFICLFVWIFFWGIWLIEFISKLSVLSGKKIPFNPLKIWISEYQAFFETDKTNNKKTLNQTASLLKIGCRTETLSDN